MVGYHGYTLSAKFNIMDLLQRKHPDILAGIGRSIESGFWCTKAPRSVICGKIGLRLLLRTNRKSPMRFRSVPKSTILDDIEGSLCTVLKTSTQALLFFTYLLYWIKRLLTYLLMYLQPPENKQVAYHKQLVTNDSKNAVVYFYGYLIRILS